MGSPAMNLIEAKTKKEKNYIKIEIKLEDGSIASLKETKNLNLPKDIIVGVRPENITENGSKTGSNYQYISSKVDIIEPAGSDTFVVTKLGNKEVTARFHSETDVQIGSKVKFSFDLEKVSYFDLKNGQRIN